MAHDALLTLPLAMTSQPRFYHCEKQWSWRPPAFVDHDLWCVVGGQGRLTAPGQAWPLHAGATFLLSPGDEVVATHDPEHRLRVFAVHFVVADAAGPRPLAEAERPPLAATVRDLALLSALARGCIAAYREGTAMGQARSLLYLRQVLLLHEAEAGARPALPADERMAALWDAIQEDPGRSWTVDELAAQAHLSRSQLTRRFTRATGLSPAQAVIQARTARARQLLRETDMSLRAIAAALGYRDLFYFSRQFRAQTGRPPSAWRQGR